MTSAKIQTCWGRPREGVFDLLRQIKEDFPEEETFELRWASFSRLRARTYVREGEDLVGGGQSSEAGGREDQGRE